MQTLTGEIRMIKYGVIPTEPSFQLSVGQMVGGKENLQIIQIVKEPVQDGLAEYHIQCAKVGDKGLLGRAFIWLTYYKQPDFVQYFVPDKDHDYVRI
jgi:hypothetical protein